MNIPQEKFLLLIFSGEFAFFVAWNAAMTSTLLDTEEL